MNDTLNHPHVGLADDILRSFGGRPTPTAVTQVCALVDLARKVMQRESDAAIVRNAREILDLEEVSSIARDQHWRRADHPGIDAQPFTFPRWDPRGMTVGEVLCDLEDDAAVDYAEVVVARILKLLGTDVLNFVRGTATASTTAPA